MATRDEIYTAIRNADKAGDSAAVRKLGDYLKTLPVEGETPQPVDASSTHEMAVQAANKPGVWDRATKLAAGFSPTGDAALHLASQAAAVPIAGIAGMVQGAKNKMIPGGMAPDERVAQVANAMTYQPRSGFGEAAQASTSFVAGGIAAGADKAGQVTTDATGSPAAGTLANVGVQALPALIMHKAPVVGRAILGKAVPAAPAATATAAAATDAATATAKAYVTGTVGLDWDALSDAVKTKLTTIAQSAGGLENLGPAAVAREAKLQSLPVPVPATAAQLTRDPVALRNEGNVSATAAGAPIRDVHLAANQALLDNLDVLKGKVTGSGATAATATSPEEVGASVQGAARGKLELAKAKTKAAYTAADTSGETLQKVDPTPILDMIEKTPDQSHYGYAKQWMKQNTDGRPVAPPASATDSLGMNYPSGKTAPAGGVAIRDLEDLRKAAVAKAMNGGEDGYYAGKLISAIDTATEGSGGKLYQAARALRKAQGTEFEEQGAVADLVSNSSRTDRTTALSNTVKTITSGAPEDIRTIKQTLLTGGDASTRTAGRQAWRDVRAQVVQQIKDDATTSVAPNVDGSPNLTAIGLQRAIAKYGPQKLDEIFGPGTTRQINAIMDAAKTVKTSPPTAAVGSSTFANVLAFLEKGITKVPLVGGTAVDIARGVAQLKNLGAGAREAQAATTTPLNEALAKASSKASRARVLGTSAQAAGASKLVPLSALGQQNR